MARVNGNPQRPNTRSIKLKNPKVGKVSQEEIASIGNQTQTQQTAPAVVRYTQPTWTEINTEREDVSFSIQNKNLYIKITLNKGNTTGKLKIENPKVSGSRVYIENVDTPVQKQDMIDMFHSTDFEISDAEVRFGEHILSIIKEDETFEAEIVGDDEINLTQENEEVSFYIKLKIPQDAGTDLEHFLYTIEKIKFNYTFESDDGTNISNIFEKDLDNVASFIYLKDFIVFAQSKHYKNGFASAIYATSDEFLLAKFRGLKEVYSPIRVKATYFLLMHYGIRSFLYSFKEAIFTSRSYPDGTSKCGIIDFGALYELVESDRAVTQTIYRPKGSELKQEIADVVIPENNIYKLPDDIDTSFIVKLETNNPSNFKNLYFFVDREKIDLMSVNSKVLNVADVRSSVIAKGSTFGPTVPSQIVQQFAAGMARSYFRLAADFFRAFAVFTFLGGGLGAMYVFSQTMAFMMYGMIMVVSNYRASRGLHLVNKEENLLGGLVVSGTHSFLGKENNIKNANTNSTIYRGGTIKSAMLTTQNFFRLCGMFRMCPILYVDEISSPSVPFSAKFKDLEPKDILDPETNIVLTHEHRYWVNFTLENLFAYNTFLPEIFLLDAKSVNAKSIRKRINTIDTHNYKPFHPFFNLQEGKLACGLKYDDLVRGDIDKMIEDTQRYKEELIANDCKNQLLLYICDQLIRVLNSTNRATLKRMFLFLRPQDPREQTLRLIYHKSSHSPAYMYDKANKNLYKSEQINTMAPTAKGEEISHQSRDKIELFHYLDNTLRQVNTIEDFERSTLPIPSGLSILL